jgi:thiol:disulfide interchange protein DsbD
MVVLMAGGLSSGARAEPPAGQPAGFAAATEQPVRVELIAEHAAIRPGGRTRVGVLFDMEDGWHIYWKRPGDAGLATSVTWSSAPEVSFGALHWPPPKEFTDPGEIRTVGYDGLVVLSSHVRHHLGRQEAAARDPRDAELREASAAKTARAGLDALPIRADVEWLACRELCILGSATLTLRLPVSTQEPAFSAHAQLFEHVDVDHSPEPGLQAP